jgi:hypothetical protein
MTAIGTIYKRLSPALVAGPDCQPVGLDAVAVRIGPGPEVDDEVRLGHVGNPHVRARVLGVPEVDELEVGLNHRRRIERLLVSHLDSAQSVSRRARQAPCSDLALLHVQAGNWRRTLLQGCKGRTSHISTWEGRSRTGLVEQFCQASQNGRRQWIHD